MPGRTPAAHYSKAQKAQAVAQAVLNGQHKASEATGIPRSTIRNWFHDPEFAELKERTRDQVADMAWVTVQKAFAAVAEGLNDPGASLRDKAVALGVVYDKWALMTGAATSRSESRDLTGTLSDAELIAALRTASDLARGAADPAA